MSEQGKLNLGNNATTTENIERYEFEPIKGYPMLHWKGKRPFTSTQFYPAQLKEQYGEPVNEWLNEIYWGDNLQVMSHLLKKYRGQVKLIYIDPPYDSKADYKKSIKLRGNNIKNDLNSFEEKQYSDIWANDEYLQFIYERLILIKELLSNDGSVYVHCDWHKSYYLRNILDEIFGVEMFKNEIIWYYYNKMQGNINKFASNHDTIYWYTKSNIYTFNKLRTKRQTPTRQIKRIWDKRSQSLVNARDENGEIIYIEATHKTVDDVWRISMLQPADQTENLRYPTQKPETLIERIIKASTNQNDIVFDCFMGSGTTQAVAMKLGRRFIGADINLGAIQTTTKRLIQVAASLNETAVPEQQKADEASDPEEQFELPIAAEPKATYQIKTIENQPDNDDSDEAPNDDDANSPDTTSEEIKTFYTGFTVYNVNHYDVFRNPVQAKDLLIEALEINPLPGNSLYDGEKDGRMVKIMPVNRIATPADLAPLLMGFDLKTFAKRKNEKPTQPVEKLLLVCMGHDPNLQATLIKEMRAQQFDIDVDVVDILRDKANLEFRRDSKARIVRNKGKLVIEQFYPMNLLQKLSLLQENVEDWRELVESVMIDWHYDGAVFEPKVVDVPGKEELVSGEYNIPDDAGTIRVKITDLLSESLEETVE